MTIPPSLRVLIAEDENLVRKGIRKLLELDSPISVESTRVKPARAPKTTAIIQFSLRTKYKAATTKNACGTSVIADAE